MADPDWANVKSVRAWLEKRYPVANHDEGSPFFQYLTEEMAKGSLIRGREKHLSGDELLRWIGDTQGTRAFHYSADAMRITYYPEYMDPSLQSRSQSPIQNDDTARHEASNSSNIHQTDHADYAQSGNVSKTKSKGRKPARKGKSAKSPGLTSPRNKTNTKQPRSKALPSVSKPKIARKSGNAKHSDQEAQQRQEARVSTLRARRNCKRGRTAFFHPDDHGRARKLS